MAIKMMLVGVDTFSLTLNRRLSTEKELKKDYELKLRRFMMAANLF